MVFSDGQIEDQVNPEGELASKTDAWLECHLPPVLLRLSFQISISIMPSFLRGGS